VERRARRVRETIMLKAREEPKFIRQRRPAVREVR
jgi:hypothetical protein